MKKATTRFNLGVICGNPKDGTSFYRAMGPLGSLRKQMPEMQIRLLEEVSWMTMKMVDVLFLQRPFSDDDVRIAEMAKKNKKPLWIDYDDDLTCVPFENPTYLLHLQAEKNIPRLLALADKVSVSTEELGVRCRPHAPDKVVVISNALDDSLFERARHRITTNKLLCWRGSNTHLKDIAEVAPGITRALQQNGKDWRVEFWGFCPYFIPETVRPYISEFNFYPPMDIIDYHVRFTESRPRIAIFPLTCNRFNQAKSHCGWLECTLAGAIAIAPDWPEWQRKGVLNYSSPEAFGDVLLTAMNMSPEECEAMNAAAWKLIKQKYLLSRVNRMRQQQILEPLVG